MAKAKTQKLYVYEAATGIWHHVPNPIPDAVMPLMVKAGAVQKSAFRKPPNRKIATTVTVDPARAARLAKRAKEQTPSERAIERAQPQPLPKPRPITPKTRVITITPQAERDKWPVAKVLRLERQAHMIDDVDECMTIIDALGGASGLAASAMSRWARPSHEGTLIIDLDRAKLPLNGRTVSCLDVIAVGKGKYDVRILDVSTPLDGGTTARTAWIAGIPDENYIGMCWLIGTVEGVTADEMLDALKAAGLDLAKPLNQVDRLKVIATEAAMMFEKCPCPECETAKLKAKANGTDMVSERLAIEPPNGEFQKLKTELASVLDPKIVNKPEDDKLRAALKRSTMLVTTEPTGTKH